MFVFLIFGGNPRGFLRQRLRSARWLSRVCWALRGCGGDTDEVSLPGSLRLLLSLPVDPAGCRPASLSVPGGEGLWATEPGRGRGLSPASPLTLRACPLTKPLSPVHGPPAVPTSPTARGPRQREEAPFPGPRARGQSWFCGRARGRGPGGARRPCRWPQQDEPPFPSEARTCRTWSSRGRCECRPSPCSPPPSGCDRAVDPPRLCPLSVLAD